MKRRPLSSSENGPDKGEESAPGDTPMARFRSLTQNVLAVPVEKVRAAEERVKRARAKKKAKPKQLD